MNIALLARKHRYELLVRFCIAYREILCKHNLFSTLDVNDSVTKAAKLDVVSYMSGLYGGFQQIASKISYGELNLIIFFRDPNFYTDINQSELDILRLCDFHNVPIATNIATAEVLIHGIGRGDFDWQKIGRPAV